MLTSGCGVGNVTISASTRTHAYGNRRVRSRANPLFENWGDTDPSKHEASASMSSLRAVTSSGMALNLFRYTRAIVGGVSSTLPAALNRAAANERQPVDVAKARQQHQEYVKVSELMK